MKSLEDKIEDLESKSFIKKALKLTFMGVLGGLTSVFAWATVGFSGIALSSMFAAGGVAGRTVKAIKSKPRNIGFSIYEIVYKAAREFNILNVVLYPMVRLWNFAVPAAGAIGSKLGGLYGSTAAKIGSATAAFSYISLGQPAAYHAYYKNTEYFISQGRLRGSMAWTTYNFYNKWKRVVIDYLPSYATAAALTLWNITAYPFVLFAANAFGANLDMNIRPIKEPAKPPKSIIKAFPQVQRQYPLAA